MAKQSIERKMPFFSSFCLSFTLSATIALVICIITPGKPPIIDQATGRVLGDSAQPAA